MRVDYIHAVWLITIRFTIGKAKASAGVSHNLANRSVRLFQTDQFRELIFTISRADLHPDFVMKTRPCFCCIHRSVGCTLRCYGVSYTPVTLICLCNVHVHTDGFAVYGTGDDSASGKALELTTNARVL